MHKRVSLIFILLFFLTELKAQKLPQDAWLWTTVSVDKQITRHWSAGVDEELRLFDNISRVNLFFTNAGITYRLNKNFKFSLVYRFINKNQSTKNENNYYFSKRHRLYLDISYKRKFLTNFSLTYRLRLQGQVRDYYSSDVGKYVESYMRHKFDLAYSYKKYSPYLAAEFRFQFTNPSFEQSDDLWDRQRFYAGCNYEINKRHSVGIYYMIQHDFNNKRAENDFTLGFQYALSL